MEKADSIKQWELVGRFCNSLRKYTNCVSSTGKGDEFADLSPDMLALCEDGIGDLFIDCKYGRFIIVKMLHDCYVTVTLVFLYSQTMIEWDSVLEMQIRVMFHCKCQYRSFYL